MAPDPQVSVTAIANGSEADGSPVVFRFSRTGSTAAPLSVSYRLLGSAQAGSDYSGATTGTISFSAGNATAKLSLPALADTLIDPGETIIAQIVPSPAATASYLITPGQQTATATINAEGMVVTVNGPSRPRWSKGEVGNGYAFAALKSDGTVVSWGDPNFGGTAPAGLSGVTQIFSNDYAFAALKSDGTVVAWDIVFDFRLGIIPIATPAGLGGVTQIFSNGSAFAALKSDGTVVSWGNPYSGGTTPTGLNGVTQIFSNSSAFAALKSDGTVVAWGRIFDDRIEDRFGTITPVMAPAELSGVTQIFSNAYAFAALKSDGTVVSWGVTGIGGTAPAGLGGVIQIFSNAYAFAALKSDGTVVCWGDASWGGTTPAGLVGVTQIFSTNSAFAALKSDGTVFSWGDPNFGGTTPAGLSGVTQIFSMKSAFAALKSDGTVVAWGGNGGTTPEGLSGVVGFANPNTNDRLLLSTTTAAVTAITDDVGIIQGTVASGATTDDISLSISGTLSAALADGETVRIYDGSTYLGNASVIGTTWSYADSRIWITVYPLNHFFSYTARVANAAGSQSAAGSAYTATFDQVAPPAPTLTLTRDTGSSSSDRLTNNASITVAGLEAGATWQYSTNSGSSWSTAQSATTTTTSFYVAPGSYSTGQVQVRQSDAAGNSTPASTTFQGFTVDTSAPLIDGIIVSASTVELSFNEALASPSSVLPRFIIAIGGSSRSLSGLQSLNSDNSSLRFSFSGAVAAAEQSFALRYIDPTKGNDITSVLQDLSGNDLATFSSTPAVLTYRSNLSSAGSLASSYKNLILAGNSDIIGIGNSQDNVLIGNSGSNALNAGAGNDTLNGDDGNDKLFGSDGNDSLDGGLGDDIMNGGTGNDTFHVDSSGDFCHEAFGQGIDTIISSIDWALSGNFENLTLIGSANVNARGNSLSNLLIGNNGNNVLNGNGGIDTMIGGLGNDTYIVDNSIDIVNEKQNSGFDWVRSSVNWILGDNLENLILTGGGNLSGTGNALNNQIEGNGGDNILDGGQGRDGLRGKGGADIFRFSNSPSYGAGGADRILDFSGSSGDRLQISRSAFGITDASASLINTNNIGLQNALKTDNLFVYNASNGYLYHNANGSAGSFGGGGVFAALTNLPTELMSNWIGLLS